MQAPTGHGDARPDIDALGEPVSNIARRRGVEQTIHRLTVWTSLSLAKTEEGWLYRGRLIAKGARASVSLTSGDMRPGAVRSLSGIIRHAWFR